MKLGFIGSGAIASAVVAGLSSVPLNQPSILLSPRNARISAELAYRFSNVRVAPTNQAVLDGSEMVVLAVRPQVARDVLSDLKFQPDHHVISLISTLSLRTITAIAAPAREATRAVPLPAVAHRRGPTPIYPPDRRVADLFGALGGAIEVETDREFDALCTATASLASYFAFAEAITSWLAQHDVPAVDARRYVAGIFEGLTHAAALAPGKSFTALADEHTTPGGINEQVLQNLTEQRVFAHLSESLDAVLERFAAIS
jgi:pyrroline-5-carboxylate reductase